MREPLRQLLCHRDALEYAIAAVIVALALVWVVRL